MFSTDLTFNDSSLLLQTRPRIKRIELLELSHFLIFKVETIILCVIITEGYCQCQNQFEIICEKQFVYKCFINFKIAYMHVTLIVIVSNYAML